jgi:hypothetical protein
VGDRELDFDGVGASEPPTQQGESHERIVTSRGGVTAAERKRRQRNRERAERLLYEVSDWRQFTDRNTLPMQAGASWEDLPALVLKEIADNACDESSEVEIALTAAGWRISDRGLGIDPDEVPRLFSVNRPMLSRKRTRLPRRGMLGQGLRVVAGYIGLVAGTITIASRGVVQVLRIDTISGETALDSCTQCTDDGWTRVTVSLHDEDIADPARRAIDFAQRSARSPGYSGPSSPWWYGPDDLRFLCRTAPKDATVADVIRDLGLTVPRSIEGAALAGTVTADDAAAILTGLRERNPEPASQRLGWIGRDDFDDFPGYAIEHGIAEFSSGARVPFVVEAYADCTRSKHYSATISGATYINRSPALSEFRLSGSPEGKRALLSGHSTYRSIEAKPGAYTLIVSVITPFVPLISTGKAPDLKHMSAEIATAVEKALKQAHRAAPPLDDADERMEKYTAAMRRFAQQERRLQRAQERETELEAWRALPGPRPLLLAIEEASAESGLSHDELSVLTAKFDPFLQDAPQRHRLGRWLAERRADLLSFAK